MKSKQRLIFPILLLMGFLSASWSIPSAYAKAHCLWNGTAPLCHGRCPAGYLVVKRTKEGPGKKCVTGTRVRCCLKKDVQIYGKGPI